METTKLDTNDIEAHRQFRVSFTENFELVLDILDAMRNESVHMGYWQQAGFVACVEDVLRSFERSRYSWNDRRRMNSMGRVPESSRQVRELTAP